MSIRKLVVQEFVTEVGTHHMAVSAKLNNAAAVASVIDTIEKEYSGDLVPWEERDYHDSWITITDAETLEVLYDGSEPQGGE